MRILAEIPHSACKITVFYMNQKYIVKFEKGNLEQSYKISELEYVISGVEDVNKRWELWLEHEAKVIQNYGKEETMHG